MTVLQAARLCIGVAEDFVLLGYDAKMLANEIPTLRGNVAVPFSGVDKSKKSSYPS
jgi:hypothetical protein